MLSKECEMSEIWSKFCARFQKKYYNEAEKELKK